MITTINYDSQAVQIIVDSLMSAASTFHVLENLCTYIRCYCATFVCTHIVIVQHLCAHTYVVIVQHLCTRTYVVIVQQYIKIWSRAWGNFTGI